MWKKATFENFSNVDLCSVLNKKNHFQMWLFSTFENNSKEKQ
jgi:hypothetical protein